MIIIMKYSRAAVVFISILAISVICSIGISAYRYWYTENYYYLVEAPCTASDSTQCFARSCVDGECPPNELEAYQVYRLKADLFPLCTDNSCENVCVNSETPGLCSLVPCDGTAGDECVVSGTQETATEIEPDEAMETLDGE
jgi:hypothetical protein